MQIKRFIYKVLDRKKFTLARYEEFLQSISKYKVLPLNEFRNYHNDNEVVIGLRFDSDSNFQATLNMMKVNKRNNISGTIFVLHTAKYFKHPAFTHDLYKLQNGNFEIGVHNDCMNYFNPTGEMHRVLKTLRREGLNIYGTSAHGDKEHNNIHFWDIRTKFQFDLQYEAYELDYNAYYSDCTFINGHRWGPDMVNWKNLKPGTRLQILFHAEHWHS